MATQRVASESPTEAVITGASHGLGRAFSKVCAGRGMDLFLTALPGSGLPEVAASLAAGANVRVAWHEADLTQEGAVETLVKAMDRRGFSPDLLINNAGIGTLGGFTDSCMSAHAAVMELNMAALVRLTYYLVPGLKAKSNAYILDVASLDAFFPMVCLPVYSATKSFVLTFTLALREEMRGSIHVSAVCPNTIRNDRETEEYVDELPIFCRWACLYPEDIAVRSIAELLRGRAVIVPEVINKVLRVVGPLVPRSMATGVIRRLWGGFGERTQHAKTSG